jgi:hypothetical protein
VEDRLKKEIEQHMPYDEFARIQTRLHELRAEEEAKLKALSELQAVFINSTTDQEKEMVKQTVGKIRDLSKAARAEIRQLNDELLQHMSSEELKEFSDAFATDYKPK